MVEDVPRSAHQVEGMHGMRVGRSQGDKLTHSAPLFLPTRSAGGAWRSHCGTPLAAIGAGRRLISSSLHRLTGRLRGGGSSGAHGDLSTTASGVTGAQPDADAEARGRLLPWGA